MLQKIILQFLIFMIMMHMVVQLIKLDTLIIFKLLIITSFGLPCNS